MPAEGAGRPVRRPRSRRSARRRAPPRRRARSRRSARTSRLTPGRWIGNRSARSASPIRFPPATPMQRSADLWLSARLSLPSLETNASAAWEAADVHEHGALPVRAYVKELYGATVALALAAQAAGVPDGAAIRDRLRAVGGGPGTVVSAGPGARPSESSPDDPTPPRSGSLLVGFALPAEAHVSWDGTWPLAVLRTRLIGAPVDLDRDVRQSRVSKQSLVCRRLFGLV